MITDQDRVLHGLTSCGGWADSLDARARVALRRLVPRDSVVAAVGDWGRRDGWTNTPPVAFVASQPAHVPIIMEELQAAMPQVLFAVDSRSVPMQAHLLDARVLWGETPLPSLPGGDSFAQAWASGRIQERHHGRVCWPDHPQVGVGGVDDWLSLRSVLLLAGLALPLPECLPQDVLDLYVARNLGMKWPPDEQRPWRSALGQKADEALDWLVLGRPMMEMAKDLHAWLFSGA